VIGLDVRSYAAGVEAGFAGKGAVAGVLASFADADTSGDGVVSREEYEAAVARARQVSACHCVFVWDSASVA
jgi:hypothetical protein